jgi:hypothetical protein
MSELKDAVLDRFAESVNVAQFVSFDPHLGQRFARVFGYSKNHRFAGIESACEALLAAAPEGTVNIRTFKAESQSSDFLQGLSRIGDIAAQIRRLAEAGYYTIINETVGMQGGVGGVHLGGAIEFAPEDTPRCVEKSGTACLPAKIALRLFETIYRSRPALEFEPSERVEFTLHPLRRGWLHEHTIIWEREEVDTARVNPAISWPNLFSRFLGDKLFGLLMADALDLPVPFATVVSRSLAPFSFGEVTNTAEVWTRTCPREQISGRFRTLQGWTDPFRFMSLEDPAGSAIASVLSQDAVDAKYSGALVSQEDGNLIIEGVRGRGNKFMLGLVPPEEIPNSVRNSVQQLYERVTERLGSVKLEWAYDGSKTWIIQVTLAAPSSKGRIIVPGSPESYVRFDVLHGLEALRELVGTAKSRGLGIILTGDVGVTSHMGDILRQSQIPSRIELVK